MSMFDFVRFRSIHCAYKAEKAITLLNQPQNMVEICHDAVLEAARAGGSAEPGESAGGGKFECLDEESDDSRGGYDTCDCGNGSLNLSNAVRGGDGVLRVKGHANPGSKCFGADLVEEKGDGENSLDDLPDLVSDEDSPQETEFFPKKSGKGKRSSVKTIPSGKRVTRGAKK